MVDVDLSLELELELEQALLALDRAAAQRVLDRVPHSPGNPGAVEQLVVASLERIGAGWESGSVALSQVYMAGRICEELIDRLLPPHDPNRTYQPRLGLAVLEDHHVLGSRIVKSVLRAAGYEVVDFGHGLAVEALAQRALAERIQVLLVSTLMLSSALKVRELAQLLHRADPRMKLVVGGAPFLFDERLWLEVGADAMGHYASDAPRLVARLGGGGR